jgi:hypothetical protein
MYVTTTKEQRDRHLETALQRTIFISDRICEIGSEIGKLRNTARRNKVRPDREVEVVQKRRIDRMFALDSAIRGGLSHNDRCELSDINIERMHSELNGKH